MTHGLSEQRDALLTSGKEPTLLMARMYSEIMSVQLSDKTDQVNSCFGGTSSGKRLAPSRGALRNGSQASTGLGGHGIS